MPITVSFVLIRSMLLDVPIIDTDCAMLTVKLLGQRLETAEKKGIIYLSHFWLTVSIPVIFEWYVLDEWYVGFSHNTGVHCPEMRGEKLVDPHVRALSKKLRSRMRSQGATRKSFLHGRVSLNAPTHDLRDAWRRIHGGRRSSVHVRTHVYTRMCETKSAIFSAQLSHTFHALLSCRCFEAALTCPAIARV